MTSPYLTLRNRLLAIVCDARGADGSLGADALAKSIPLGRFRRAQDGAPLRDPAYPAGALDRAVRVDWLSEADDEGVNNPLQAPHFYASRVSVTHAILYGSAISAAISVASGETAATVALQPQERALMDARRIRRALACPDLLRAAADSDPVPLACVREGETTLEDLGNGRLLAVSTYTLRWQSDNAANGDP